MEIKNFLTQMLETEVDSPTAADLAEKTEGWVTGLVLAAISMREQGRLDHALLEPQVNAHSVMEYLFTEVFSRQPPEITRYLMTTSILDRFCGPLCQAVCTAGSDPSTVKTDGWEFIAWLNKQNLFLIPLDNKKQWFRFQIDVLALQALLHDSRGEEPAALESLTHALQLAEPGGFIRSFVDQGPKTADLLKRLHKQKIAVDYIEKILAAFEEEVEQVVVTDTSLQTTVSAREPRRTSRPSQPLVDPLTNRELDILELLAQRLSNKEIADKLFISTTTVKGHLQNIYGKLKVNKRREAVEKVRKIGIL